MWTRNIRCSEAPAVVGWGSTNSIRSNAWPNLARETFLHIPLKFSGLPERNVLLVNGMKLTLTAPEGTAWTGGWKSAYTEVWPETGDREMTYAMKRRDYERLKRSSVRVQIELALSQYVEDQPRELILSGESFSDKKLGICRINPFNWSDLDCLKPFSSPGFIASVDFTQSPCGAHD